LHNISVKMTVTAFLYLASLWIWFFLFLPTKLSKCHCSLK